MSIAEPKSIVVPVDFSEASFDAIKVAMEMAESADKVHVVYVAPMPQTEADFLRQAFTEESLERIHSELKGKLEEHGYGGVDSRILEGAPGDEISAAAETFDADIIVMPSHSRTGLPRLFLGSVAGQVLRSAPCPVLVLRRK